MERELVRAFHHAFPSHKADHFYNFCITAHSLREYLLERLGKTTPSAAQPFHDRWSKEPFIAAVADIANSAKHFQLRDHKTRAPKAAKTRKVRAGKTSAADIYVDPDGNFHVVKRSGIPTYVVTLEDGRHFELYAFMEAVTKYWRAELAGAGIKVRRQPWRQLHGRVN